MIKNFNWYPRVLVIGPGGVKGLKVLGFLAPLEDSGLLNFVDTYCGVSVGAIISLLIISGYQIRELISEGTNLDLFKEIHNFNFQTSMENKGLLSNEPMKKHLSQLILDKFGNIPTLHNLYMRTGKAFITVTLNATDEECVMMTPFTHPSMSCVDATMFSMNIPFIFYQLIYKHKIYVDGALANPYPIDFFDDGKTNILGVYMKTIHKKDLHSESLPISTYCLKIFHSLMDHRRNHIIQLSSNLCKHVCLECDNVDTTGSSLDIDEKVQMLVDGFNRGKKFLYQLQSNTYVGPKIPPHLYYSYPPYDIITQYFNYNDAQVTPNITQTNQNVNNAQINQDDNNTQLNQDDYNAQTNHDNNLQNNQDDNNSQTNNVQTNSQNNQDDNTINMELNNNCIKCTYNDTIY